MNRALFITMLRSKQRAILGFSVGSLLYLWLVIWIYPSIADSGSMNKMLQSLPENMQSLVGLENGVQQLSDYLAGEFYGLLFLIIISIYSVVTGASLVARLVDRGSMAYLLSTPTSRAKIALTQASILLFGLFVIMCFIVGGGFLGTMWISADLHLDTSLFIQVNIVGFLLFVVISGYSFLLSCLFNDEKRAVGVSAFLTIMFFAFYLVGRLSSEIEWVQNFSVFSVFDPQAIFHGEAEIVSDVSGLVVAGGVLYTVAVVIFRNRDLPL